jgi:transcription elongation factor Elf1
MNTGNENPADEILTCPKCGGKTMSVHVEENEVQSIRCASCRHLVGYTSKLIRVLDEP